MKASTRTSSAKAAKPVAKQAAKPAKAPAKSAVKKPVATKTTVKAVAKPKPGAKQVIKPVAKKAVPAKGAKAPVKAVAKGAAKPVAKTPPKGKVPLKSKAPVKAVAKTAVKTVPKSASKPVVATPKLPTPKAVAPKPVKTVAAPAPVVAPPPPPAPVPAPRKSSRAAKAASMVPPPPAPVVASNAAKSSYGPISSPSLPSFVPVIPKKDAKLANNWKTTPVDKLSDAEVLAMPDSEYMNDTQMAFFRLKLVQLKQDILNNAGETTEHLREDTVVVPDPADRATIEEEHALELRTRDRERKLLKKIEQSIALIDAGDYGYCDETGEPIGVGRLLARPTATLSLEAQQRRELKQKMFGD